MNKLSVYLLIAVLALFISVFTLSRRCNYLANEKERYLLNSDALLSEIERKQIDSATMALDVKTLCLTLEEYKRYRAEDASMIKQLGIKLKNMEAVARHEIAVDVPIHTQLRDSVIIRDTVPLVIRTIEVSDPFVQIRGIIEGDSLSGSIHLPVTLRQAVWIEYKRKFLLWKKVKAVHQTISSDNPYVQINYSEFINIQK